MLTGSPRVPPLGPLLQRLRFPCAVTGDVVQMADVDTPRLLALALQLDEPLLVWTSLATPIKQLQAVPLPHQVRSIHSLCCGKAAISGDNLPEWSMFAFANIGAEQEERCCVFTIESSQRPDVFAAKSLAPNRDPRHIVPLASAGESGKESDSGEAGDDDDEGRSSQRLVKPDERAAASQRDLVRYAHFCLR